jgi:hypothetical protein
VQGLGCCDRGPREKESRIDLTPATIEITPAQVIPRKMRHAIIVYLMVLLGAGCYIQERGPSTRPPSHSLGAPPRQSRRSRPATSRRVVLRPTMRSPDTPSTFVQAVRLPILRQLGFVKSSPRPTFQTGPSPVDACVNPLFLQHKPRESQLPVARSIRRAGNQPLEPSVPYPRRSWRKLPTK